jgi:hypothetical protein
MVTIMDLVTVMVGTVHPCMKIQASQIKRGSLTTQRRWFRAEHTILKCNTTYCARNIVLQLIKKFHSV